MEQTEIIQEASSRVMRHFMSVLDESRSVLNDILITGIIEISDSLTPLSSSSADVSESLAIYVDVVVSKSDVAAQQEIVHRIAEHESLTLEIPDSKELSVNYFLVNPDIYVPTDRGGYDIEVADGVPIVLGSVDQAALFDHGPLQIETLRSHKADGVLSEETFNSIREGDLVSFPVLILISI